MQLLGSALIGRIIDQVIEQVEQAACAFADNAGFAGSRRAVLFCDQLRIAHDAGQWRAQIVADVCQKGVFGLQGFLGVKQGMLQGLRALADDVF